MTIQWEDSMAMGIEEIDKQHQEIFVILNDLFGVKDDSNINSNEALLNKLTDYSNRHFATEHKYFLKFNYPELKEHEKDHQRYDNKIKKFGKLEKNNDLPFPDIVDFITDWWLTHVMRQDQDFKKYLIEQKLI